jgi:hypothetical protein
MDLDGGFETNKDNFETAALRFAPYALSLIM